MKFRVYGERYVYQVFDEEIEAEDSDSAHRIATYKLKEIETPDGWEDTLEPCSVFNCEQQL